MSITQCIGSPWGAIATGILDGPGCVLACRDSFRRSFVPDNETFERVCERLTQLNDSERDTALLELYCCDSQLCGVDNINQPGNDRKYLGQEAFWIEYMQLTVASS